MKVLGEGWSIAYSSDPAITDDSLTHEDDAYTFTAPAAPGGLVILKAGDQTIEVRTPADTVQTNEFRFRISREMALDYGMVQPTVEEAEATVERIRESRETERAAWALYDEAVIALDSIENPLARAVLDLHAPTTRREWWPSPTCGGCDTTDEPPPWPCATAAVVAEHYSIDLPGQHALHNRDRLDDPLPTVESLREGPWPRPPIFRPEAFVNLTSTEPDDGG